MAQVLNGIVDIDEVLFDGRQHWQVTFNLRDNYDVDATFVQEGYNPAGDHQDIQAYADDPATHVAVLTRMQRTERVRVMDRSSGLTPAEVLTACDAPLWNTTEDMHRAASGKVMAPNTHPRVLLYFEEVYNYWDGLNSVDLSNLLGIDVQQAAQLTAKTDKVFKTRYTYKEFTEIWDIPL